MERGRINESWNVENWERVLMCFISRLLDAVCLGKACLSMANRFSRSLRIQSSKFRSRATVRIHDRKMEHMAIKQASEQLSVIGGEGNSIAQEYCLAIKKAHGFIRLHPSQSLIRKKERKNREPSPQSPKCCWHKSCWESSQQCKQHFHMALSPQFQ